jgi:hypothetical protein
LKLALTNFKAQALCLARRWARVKSVVRCIKLKLPLAVCPRALLGINTPGFISISPATARANARTAARCTGSSLALKPQRIDAV